MTTFIATVLLAFAIFSGAALFINYCKSRPASGRHQLTGMCHCSGGPAGCGSGQGAKDRNIRCKG